jgi:hypothetical protein
MVYPLQETEGMPENNRHYGDRPNYIQPYYPVVFNNYNLGKSKIILAGKYCPIDRIAEIQRRSCTN